MLYFLLMKNYKLLALLSLVSVIDFLCINITIVLQSCMTPTTILLLQISKIVLCNVVFFEPCIKTEPRYLYIYLQVTKIVCNLIVLRNRFSIFY